jgi:hypothetical protein
MLGEELNIYNISHLHKRSDNFVENFYKMTTKSENLKFCRK